MASLGDDPQEGPSSSKTYSWRVMESCPVSKPCSGVKIIGVDEAVAPTSTSIVEKSSSAESSNLLSMVDKTRLKKSTLDENMKASGEEGLLGLDIFNQEDLERGIMQQVDTALEVEERKRKKKRTEKEMKSVVTEIVEVERDLERTENAMAKLEKMEKEGSMLFGAVQKDWDALGKHREVKRSQLKTLKAKKKKLTSVLSGKEVKNDEDPDGNILGDVFDDKKRGETDRERMIRLGEITPFGTAGGDFKTKAPKVDDERDAQGTPIGSDFEGVGKDVAKIKGKRLKNKKSVSKSKRRVREIEEEDDSAKAADDSNAPNLFDANNGRRYKNTDVESSYDFSRLRQSRAKGFSNLSHNLTGDGRPDVGDDGNDDVEAKGDGDWQEKSELFDAEDDSSEEEESGDEEDDGEPKAKRQRKGASTKKKKTCNEKKKLVKGSIGSRPVYHSDESDAWDEDAEDNDDDKTSLKKFKRGPKVHDDGDYKSFKKRIAFYESTQVKSKDKDVEFEGDSGGGNLKVPGDLWAKLYPYQRTGVRWLWELHQQQCGGIIGDEMGLGKTIQVIAFLAALRVSKLRDIGFSYIGLGPVLIVVPATVLHQWVKEFHIWCPQVRVAILHDTGSYKGSKTDLIWDIVEANGMLLTSYSSIVTNVEELADRKWHYVILDEGHKIRNPDAQITLAVKRFTTPHRIIMSGTPIQNNLKELWSLFDFVFPGKLGTLPAFMTHFAVPIVQGGYANASEMQVMTAYKCACMLRDTISPYLLRRMKADLQTSLKMPDKTEQVLFCRLTPEQVHVYRQYLESEQCTAILRGNYKVFVGLITLRKICNHPDLASGGPRVFKNEESPKEKEMEFGYYKRSGKLVVVDALLKLWKKQGHRVLLFSQSRQMLDVIEKFVLQEKRYTYLRLDGGTGIGSRQNLINRFNQEDSLFVFLLTTKVGGLGVNLIGADRIIIFDPDWNPSTDCQARERAWRIGQTKQVTIYRLLCSGTIEEKIYHRQIFKQFLTNRVLKDPKQRRLFKSNDLHELFTLSKDYDEKEVGQTETSAIFAGTGLNIDIDVKKEKRKRKRKDENIFNQLERDKKDGDEEEKPKVRSKRKVESISKSAAEEKEIKGAKKKTDTEEDKKRKMMERAKALSRKIAGLDAEAGGSDDQTGNSKVKVEKAKDEGNKPKGGGSKVAKNGDSKDKKRHKKKRKDAHLEGNKIKGLKKWEPYKRPKSGDDEEENSNESANSREKSAAQDEYVLAKLFKKSGVHSALRHDAIVDSGAPDYAIVEAEAKKVAAEAAARLKASRKLCAPAAAGIPSWTGNNGGVTQKPKFGQKKNTKLLRDVLERGKAKEDSPKKSSSRSNSPSASPKSSSKSFPNASFAASAKFNGRLVGSAEIDLRACETHSEGVLEKNPSSSLPSAAALSSADLIKNMKIRNIIATSTASASRSQAIGDEDASNSPAATPTSSAAPPSSLLTSDYDNELIEDIRHFIAFQSGVGGVASTEEILEKFKDKVASENTAKFKSMLKEICDYSKDDEGKGLWRLKLEFQ